MNTGEKILLKRHLCALSAMYGRELKDVVLAMYIEDLGDLPLLAIEDAIRSYRQNPQNRTMPLPAQLRGIVYPAVDDESLGREAAARIVAAVSRFGQYNGPESEEYIGELGWHVVRMQGGWQHVCECLGVSVRTDTFQAQARDLAISLCRKSKIGDIDTPPALPEPQHIPEPLRELVYGPNNNLLTATKINSAKAAQRE